MKPEILIVEDNRKLAALFQEALNEGFQTKVAGTLQDARRVLADCDGLLLDLQLPDGDGLTLIPSARQANPAVAIIVVTAYGTVQKAVEALRQGALDFLEKPVDLDSLLQRFTDQLRPHLPRGLVAESRQMQEVVALADRVAQTPFPVLITGETGTGKDVMARHIHLSSKREPFVALNCASLPAELTESLLFGHLRGAFTGAVETREGLVASAEGGSLFLDEIGDLSMTLQPKLLRFLDTKTYQPVGSRHERQGNVRIIAATNKDLQQATTGGTFREDLYFRLATFPLNISPLRERPQDIPPLARFQLDRLAKVLGYPISIVEDALDLLQRHHFPGNVRELFNILDRAALLSGGTITVSSLRPLLPQTDDENQTTGDFWSESRAQAARRERELIDLALVAAGGNKAAAARALKVSYKTLLNKMKRLGLYEQGHPAR